MNREQVRQVADIIEMEGFIEVSDSLREGRGGVRVKMVPFEPLPGDSVEEIIARNPDINVENIKKLNEYAMHCVRLYVGEREVIIHEDVARRIKDLL